MNTLCKGLQKYCEKLLVDHVTTSMIVDYQLKVTRNESWCAGIEFEERRIKGVNAVKKGAGRQLSFKYHGSKNGTIVVKEQYLEVNVDSTFPSIDVSVLSH